MDPDSGEQPQKGSLGLRRDPGGRGFPDEIASEPGCVE